MSNKDVIWADEKTLSKDISGKVYIVTGANSGVGLETTRQLIKQGGHVVMACRRPDAAEEAAKIKGINSPVAGKADILLFPGIESANITAKATLYFSNFPLAHATMGAKAPVLIPSRAESAEAKLFTIALNVVIAGHKV